MLNGFRLFPILIELQKKANEPVKERERDRMKQEEEIMNIREGKKRINKKLYKNDGVIDEATAMFEIPGHEFRKKEKEESFFLSLRVLR